MRFYTVEFRGRDRLASCAWFILVGMWLAVFPQLAFSQGADLPTNPHNELECTKCHVRKPSSRKNAGLIPHERGVVAICLSCHPDFNLHPVEVDPKKASVEINVPPELPLAKSGKNKGRIVCTTCHDIHFPTAQFKLLRVSDSSMGFAKLCRKCHGERLRRTSPHEMGKTSCRFCHANDPKDKDFDASYRKRLSKRCTMCHGFVSPKEHFAKIGSFKSEAEMVKALDGYKIELIDKKFICVSCHDPHSKKDIKYLLRKEFYRFAKDSPLINPHWKGTFCDTCHKSNPEGKVGGVIDFRDDFIAICKRCHAARMATPELHPVDITPSSNIKVPKDFILTDGKMTCVTCHNFALQNQSDPAVRRKHPKFLKGGPYTNRTQICYKCHVRRQYKQYSPHNQMDRNGKILEQTCTFCHKGVPNRNEGDYRKAKLKKSLKTFCVGCHIGKNKWHPMRVTHFGKKPPAPILNNIKMAQKRLEIVIPLSEEQTLVCPSCHNPHARGVLLNAKAAKGAGEKHRLRLPKGYQICLMCHGAAVGKPTVGGYPF